VEAGRRRLIRPFEPGDAEEVARLTAALLPATVETAASLLHRHAAEPERSRRRSWVALDGGAVAGFATAFFHWFGGEAGTGHLWVGVREDHRRRGVGTELWQTALENLDGARRVTVEVDADPAGLAFAERRGFADCGGEVKSRLDVRACRLSPEPQAGFRVLALRDVLDRDADLYAFYGRAGGIPLGDPLNRVTLEEWGRFVLGNPLLDEDASVVVLDPDGRVVSLSWLLVDAATGRAENEWTATLPELRGRGLARLAKLASIRRAAERGIRELTTGNDPDNLPMRELNRRLGYVELFDRRELERAAPAGR